MSNFIWVPFNLIKVAQFPEKHQQLLVELDFLGGVGKVRLSQRIGQETSQALQHKVIVLQMEEYKDNFQ